MASRHKFLVFLLALLTIAGTVGFAYLLLYLFYMYPVEVHIWGYPGKQISPEHRLNITVGDQHAFFYFDHGYIEGDDGRNVSLQDTLKANLSVKIGYRGVEFSLYNTSGSNQKLADSESRHVFIFRSMYVYVGLSLDEGWVRDYLSASGRTKKEFLDKKTEVLPVEAFDLSVDIRSSSK